MTERLKSKSTGRSCLFGGRSGFELPVLFLKHRDDSYSFQDRHSELSSRSLANPVEQPTEQVQKTRYC